MVFIRAEVKRGLALEHPSQAASNLAGFFFLLWGEILQTGACFRLSKLP